MFGDVFTFKASTVVPTLEIPVLFDSDSGDALAYTNNNVNSLIDGSNVFTAKTWGPHVNHDKTGDSDILGDYIQALFAKAGLTAIPVEDREYHDKSGSIHCGTNVQRTIPSFDWWED